MATKKRKRLPILRYTLLILGLVFIASLGVAVAAGYNAAASAPDVTTLEWNSSTMIYDRNGNEVYRLHAGENRIPIELDQIPEKTLDAFIAVEDPNFYNHRGIDPRGVARAAFRTALHLLGLPGGRLEGGSTITQQLARDAWLSQEVSIKRKLQEAWVAVQLERIYTKDEILEMYLNQIYFGHGAYGIEAAANTFFGKDVENLSLAESAQLAGMINGPSYFDPYVHPEASLERRDVVLAAMLKEGKISSEEHESAKAEKPKVGAKQSAATVKASYFTDYIINILQEAKPELVTKYGLDLGNIENVAKAGLAVHTTLDPNLQKLAEQAVADQMSQADKQYASKIPKGARLQAAMVVIHPRTGEVLAMVGGREHTTMLEFNRATDALRQPGSAIKPLVDYIPALEKGLSPATILDDAPVMLTMDGKDVWPQNYNFVYEGLKPARYGVEQSVNPMAVRAMIRAGGPSVGVDYAHRFGLATIGKEDDNLALALGGISKGVTVLDMAAAYTGIANMGNRVDPVVITRIEDRTGRVLFQARPKKQSVTRAGAAYLMIDMMKDVIRRGTAYGFTGGFKGWPAAGKTGTTENNRDGWFIGFTPELVTAVWNGYDADVAKAGDQLPYTGAFVPVKIWNQFMTQAVTAPPADWPRPTEVTSVQVCRLTGMLPDDACPKDQIVSELFLKGSEPTSAGNLLAKAKAVQVTVQSPDKKSTVTEWRLWQTGCVGKPVDRLFIRRPEPRVLHPTRPNDPKYVPKDVKDELPVKKCEPVSWLDRLFPKAPQSDAGEFDLPGLDDIDLDDEAGR